VSDRAEALLRIRLGSIGAAGVNRHFCASEPLPDVAAPAVVIRCVHRRP
jgi:hypothetical protein